MLQPGLLPLGVGLHTRGIRHPDLSRDVIHRRDRHINQRVDQERAQRPYRAQLQTEPEPIVITTVTGHHLTIRIIQEEDSLQGGRSQRRSEPAVRRGLRLAQELPSHDTSTTRDQTGHTGRPLAPDPAEMLLNPRDHAHRHPGVFVGRGGG